MLLNNSKKITNVLRFWKEGENSQSKNQAIIPSMKANSRTRPLQLLSIHCWGQKMDRASIVHLWSKEVADIYKEKFPTATKKPPKLTTSVSSNAWDRANSERSILQRKREPTWSWQWRLFRRRKSLRRICLLNLSDNLRFKSSSTTLTSSKFSISSTTRITSTSFLNWDLMASFITSWLKTESKENSLLLSFARICF